MTLGDHQRTLIRLGKTKDEAAALLIPENWWDALGSEIGANGRQAALGLLVDEGLNRGEASFVLTVVAREIEHDEPDRAQRVLRSWLPVGSEILLIRTLATLCCPP